jgi:hypothetical protein
MAGPVARASLSQAMALSNMLDGVNAALAGLAASFTVAGIFLRDSDGNQISVELPLPTNAVQNLLTNRQTALQNALTALGVT